MQKIKKWIKDYAKEILGVAIIGMIVGGTLYMKHLKDIYTNLDAEISTPTVVKQEVKTIIKTVDNKPLATPKCSPAEINYTLKNTDKLLASKNWLVLDLDTFKKTRTVIKYGKRYEYYQRFGKDDLFVTIATKIKKDTLDNAKNNISTNKIE